MANISAIKKINHTVTADEVSAGLAAVSVLWDSPFYDTNYVVAIMLETGTTDSNSFVLSITNVSSAGFDINWVVQDTEGSKVVFHCMASHK